MNFTGFIIIAFGIMQIILFFKIWGMTNNVNRIWKKIDSKDFLSEACITYIKGDLEETNKLANEAFLQEVAMLSKSSNAYADWEEGFNKHKKRNTRVFLKRLKNQLLISTNIEMQKYIYYKEINSTIQDQGLYVYQNW